MGRSVSDFSFKAILQSILIENQPTYKRKETVDIVKHYKNGQGSGQENLAVGKMFDCIFDNKFFKFDEDDSNFSILQEYYKNDRALGQFFNRKLDRGSIKGKKFLEAIANQIQNNPSGTIQHLTDNLVSFLRKRKAETITKEHTVFQELSPSKIGNKSADKIVEYIKVCANKDPYMALAVMLLISLYPIPSSTSRNPDLLETVITKSLLGSRSFKESGASQTDFSDPILNLDPSQKDDGDIITVNLPRNKLAEIRRILGFENVKEKVFVVLPLFSAIIAVLSIVHLFTRNIEFNPSDSRPDVTVISTGTTISSTITSSISTSTTTVNTTESSSNTISSSTANTDTTTDDNLNTSSLTSDITEPLDDDSGESNIATESEETTVPQRPISLNKNQLTLNTVGDSRTYHLTCDDAHLRNLNWTSSNSSIASVNQDGLVTALKDGTATIMVSANGSSASCTVSVRTSYDESWSDWSDWTATPITASDSVEVRTEDRSSQVLVSYNMDGYTTRKADTKKREYRNVSVNNGDYSLYGLDTVYGEWHQQYTYSAAEVQSATVIPPGGEQGGDQNGVNATNINGYSLLYGGVYYIFFITSENYDTVYTTYYRSRELTRTPTVYNN